MGRRGGPGWPRGVRGLEKRRRAGHPMAEGSPERHHGTRGTALPVEARELVDRRGSPASPCGARCRELHAAHPDRLRHPGDGRRVSARPACAGRRPRLAARAALRETRPPAVGRTAGGTAVPSPASRCNSNFDDMGCERNRCILAIHRSSITVSAGSVAIAPPAGWEANAVPAGVLRARWTCSVLPGMSPRRCASARQRASPEGPRNAQAAPDGRRGDARPARVSSRRFSPGRLDDPSLG